MIRRADNSNQKPSSVRCAIYTRKSTDEGLDMDFNSLDAQREAGEAYVASQKSQGWVLLRGPLRRRRVHGRHIWTGPP